LVHSDAENGILKNEKNIKNQKPEHLDPEKIFAHCFLNIWELSASKNQICLEKLAKILKTKYQTHDQ
jgi:hypothetical protein